MFKTDWNDGLTLCSLVKSLGGPVAGYKTLTSDPSSWEHNLNLGKYLLQIFFIRRKNWLQIIIILKCYEFRNERR